MEGVESFSWAWCAASIPEGQDHDAMRGGDSVVRGSESSKKKIMHRPSFAVPSPVRWVPYLAKRSDLSRARPMMRFSPRLAISPSVLLDRVERIGVRVDRGCMAGWSSRPHGRGKESSEKALLKPGQRTHTRRETASLDFGVALPCTPVAYS
jgi:hypothetical protein